MKVHRRSYPFNKCLSVLGICLSAAFFGSPATFADILNLASGNTITGTILQTNEVCVLVLTEFGTLSYPRSLVKDAKVDPAEAPELSDTNRIPGFKKTVLSLAKQPWAANLRQIPATVIDNGVLRAVPYKSFRCGEDYEVNVYGDPDAPAAIEVGVYRTLTESNSAKDNCIHFISSLLGRAADQEIVLHLDKTKDLKSSEGLTIETTPPSAPDA